MPITTSAKKALRSSKRKKMFNTRKKDLVGKTVKKVTKLLKEGKASEAAKLMPEVQKVLDKSAKTGLIKKNTAARKKSRIAAMIKKAGK